MKPGEKENKDVKLSLKGINFTINPKEKIGIIGKSGAGKTSLMNLLLRVNSIETSNNSGIFIDDIDINTIELDAYRKKLTIIPQEPAIFSQSLKDNLSSDD